ncbi:MAG: endonuclease/exonuclease/phosphatase family protein [Candidatus Roizmanbacteria bacterium]|nr:endonuclease/exonuclease/phosphatase family protein [Candidatus Roizmanbacteria bacterium]
MNSQITLVSINIEGDKHLDKIIPFIKQEQPDVVCLQEVMQSSVDHLKESLNMELVFVPMKQVVGHGVKGIAIATNLPILETWVLYYAGDKDVLPVTQAGEKRDPYANNHMVLAVRVEKNGDTYTFADTHFTWSPDGHVIERQEVDAKNMLAQLSTLPECILCGDFNAPRGGSIWGKIAQCYTDNIPSNVTTTIDPQLHRAGPLPYVVDGLFSSRGYTISDAKVVSGISDHQAIVGSVRIA